MTNFYKAQFYLVLYPDGRTAWRAEAGCFGAEADDLDAAARRLKSRIEADRRIQE